MRRFLFLSLLFLLIVPVSALEAQYIPARGAWEVRDPAAVGMDPEGIAAAVAHALASESGADPDQELSQSTSFGREPMGFGIGPFRVREGVSATSWPSGVTPAGWR